MDFLGALSNLLKFLSLNSIMQQVIHDRIVYCDRLEEEGIIHLQVRRGIIPLPYLIAFNMPLNSRISEFQDTEEVFEFFAKIEHDEKRNIQRGFLDFSKITFHPRIQSFLIRYARIRDILDFDERRLEIFKKEYVRENIKVYDERGTLIEASLERLYQKNGIRLEGDISWLSDINPNERKTFNFIVSGEPLIKKQS